jgi:hypothetical protein
VIELILCYWIWNIITNKSTSMIPHNHKLKPLSFSITFTQCWSPPNFYLIFTLFVKICKSSFTILKAMNSLRPFRFTTNLDLYLQQWVTLTSKQWICIKILHIHQWPLKIIDLHLQLRSWPFLAQNLTLASDQNSFPNIWSLKMINFW